MYHDNTKEYNRIYRSYIPNGSAEMINQVIVAQSTRFVISSKTTLDKHFKFCEDYLNNTSLELKIESMRQILTKFPITNDNYKSHEIMKVYLDKYEKMGNLSEEDQHELIVKLKAVQAEFVKKIIK